MREYLENIFDNYQKLPKIIDSTKEVYQTVVRHLPKHLEAILKRSDFLIQGSAGKGYVTQHPWVSILNKHITRSTQEGLYIVYLFRSDMKGVYLTLSQGVTQFERKYLSKKYEYLKQVSEYFQSEFSEYKDEYLTSVDLVSKKGTLGYGYEQSIIFAKYYDALKLQDYNFVEDLQQLVKIYDEVYHHMSHQSYEQTISHILSDQFTSFKADQAIQDIKLVLNESSSYPRTDKSMVLVDKKEAKTSRLKKISEPAQTKIDYLKKATQDAYTGLEGEHLVLDYEIERLIQLGLHEEASKVSWISQSNDVAGYDIKSFDFVNGKLTDLFIEVKTTVSKLDTDFYVSKNEFETSNKLKDQYAIYRVYDVLNANPKFYIAKGAIEDNFYLEPSTYKARYKWSVE